MSLRSSLRILVLLSDHPDPPFTGPKVRNFYLWPALRKLGAQVKILGFNQSPELDSHTRSFEGEFFSPEPLWFPLKVSDILFRSYHHRPHSQKLMARVQELLHTWKPQIIHAEELRMARFFPKSQTSFNQTYKKTCTFLNVESELILQTGSYPFKFGQKFFNAFHIQSTFSLEKKMTQRIDLGFAYSQEDLVKYQKLYPQRQWSKTRGGANALATLPKPQTPKQNLLFVGSLFYTPNIQGLFWFIDQVLPKLSESIVFTVVGSHPTPEVKKKLIHPKIKFFDTVPNLEPLYAQNALCVVPLFQGGGTRGKILEALAYERMVITTPLGCEGLELKAGEGMVLASKADEFAQKINYFLKETQEREIIAKRGRKAVIEKYDWSIVAANLMADWSNCLKK